MSEIWQESWIQGHLELQSKILSQQNIETLSIMDSDTDRILNIYMNRGISESSSFYEC